VNFRPGEVLSLARRWAQELLQCSPMSLRATKQAVLAGLDKSVADALAAEGSLPAIRALLASADAVEGPKAFAEKRSPNWLGR